MNLQPLTLPKSIFGHFGRFYTYLVDAEVFELPTMGFLLFLVWQRKPLKHLYVAFPKSIFTFLGSDFEKEFGNVSIYKSIVKMTKNCHKRLLGLTPIPPNAARWGRAAWRNRVKSL